MTPELLLSSRPPAWPYALLKLLRVGGAWSTWSGRPGSGASQDSVLSAGPPWALPAAPLEAGCPP
eukprot:353200-Chlamydomonas_euryale.AAC.4